MASSSRASAHTLDFSLFDVATGNAFLTKKAYFEPKTPGPLGDLINN